MSECVMAEVLMQEKEVTVITVLEIKLHSRVNPRKSTMPHIVTMIFESAKLVKIYRILPNFAPF